MTRLQIRVVVLSVRIPSVTLFNFLQKPDFNRAFFVRRLNSIGLVQWVQLSAELASPRWLGRCSAPILLSPLPE